MPSLRHLPVVDLLLLGDRIDRVAVGPATAATIAATLPIAGYRRAISTLRTLNIRTSTATRLNIRALTPATDKTLNIQASRRNPLATNDKAFARVRRRSCRNVRTRTVATLNFLNIRA